MKYRLPAEWEPQSGIQLTWPHRDTDWAPMLDEVLTVYHAMAREISRRERLLVVAPEGGAPGMVHVVCPTNDTWARDHGFITLVDDLQIDDLQSIDDLPIDDLRFDTSLKQIVNRKSVNRKSTSLKQIVNRKSVNRKLLDFCFNGWGGKFPADLDNAINRRLYDLGAVKGEYVSHLDFVLEGGSIESDGRGTIFTTSGCLLAPHRNQPLTRQDIEERLKRWLCADRIIWIDHGQLTGDDTDGHIDTLVRIAPDDTLLYVGCDDPHDEQYRELLLMEEQLHTFRTIDGRPYRLLRLPMPRPIYDEPEVSETISDQLADSIPQRLPATYANFLVINGAVLCPTYGQPDLDQEALRIIGRAFPGRDIVGIDCRPLIRQHGSLHCCTMQFPAISKTSS